MSLGSYCVDCLGCRMRGLSAPETCTRPGLSVCSSLHCQVRQPTQPPTRTPHHTGNPPLSGGRARAFALFLFLVEVDAGQKERSIVVTYPVNHWRRGERRAASRGPQLLICCICADMRCKTNLSTRYQHVQTGHAQTGHARR